MIRERMFFLTRNPFEFINTNDGFANDYALRGIVLDIFELLFSVGLGLIVVSLVVLFIRWALYRNKEGALNRRNVIVGPVIMKMILVAAISAFPYLITLVFQIINSIAKAAVS